MSVLNVYVIRDKVAEQCGPVYTAENDGVAARGFRQAMLKVSDPLDFQLLKVGEFDTFTGKLDPFGGSDPKVIDVALPEVMHESK